MKQKVHEVSDKKKSEMWVKFQPINQNSSSEIMILLIITNGTHRSWGVARKKIRKSQVTGSWWRDNLEW